MKTGAILALTALSLLLAVAASWAIYAWISVGHVSMSIHGWIAMTLGVVFSLIVGVGLMGLVFYSARQGYDEPHGQD